MKTDIFISKIDQEKFKKFRDQFMREIENDLYLIAWFAYGLDLLFKDKTYNQMKDYIGKASEEELKKYLVKVDNPEIYNIDNPGISPDVIYDLYNIENGKRIFIGTLGIDNQIKEYSSKQKINRSQFYICSLVFRQGRKGGKLNKKTYENIEPVYHIWLYPEPAGKRNNKIIIESSYQPQDVFLIEKEGNNYPTKPVTEFHQLHSVVYNFYLGNPMEITNIENQSDIKKRKLLYLLRLVDLVFQFGFSKEERLKQLDTDYNLKSQLTEEEVEVMSELETLVNMFYKRDREEIDQLEKQLKEKDNQLKNKDNQLKNKDNQLKNKDIQLEKQIKEKDNLIAARDQEIKDKNSKIKELESLVKELTKNKPLPV